jgi:hypothetical protein
MVPPRTPSLTVHAFLAEEAQPGEVWLRRPTQSAVTERVTKVAKALSASSAAALVVKRVMATRSRA